VLGRSHKKKLIARHRAYHGCSVVSGSLTGLPFYHQAFDLPVGRVLHTATPHYYWNAEAGMSEREFSQYCADQLEAMIIRENPETVAAFFGEPVLGTGGIIPPPEGYWEAIQKVLNKYDVLLVADEVVTGFGRIGSYFGSPHYGMKPDLITVAKGMTSGYLPLSGVIIGERVWSVLEKASDMLGAMSHGYTYSGHAVAAAAAIANLNIIAKEKLVDNARDTGAYLQRRMHETFAEHPLVGEVRGIGMLAALEFVADKGKRKRLDPNLKVGARMSAATLENGLIARALPHGDILGFAPPLIVTPEQVDDIIERTRRAVDKVTDELVREGAWQG
jgi:L-2,4-diaminobutyrate transaminase